MYWWASHIMLTVIASIIVLLRVLHRHGLVHVWSAGHRVCQSGTACNLMGRIVRELLTTLLKCRRHSTTTLTLRASELRVCGRIARHWLLLLVLGLEPITTATAALRLESTTSWTCWVVQLILRRLRRLSAEVTCLLVSRSGRALCARGLSHVTLSNMIR